MDLNKVGPKAKRALNLINIGIKAEVITPNSDNTRFFLTTDMNNIRKLEESGIEKKNARTMLGKMFEMFRRHGSSIKMGGGQSYALNFRNVLLIDDDDVPYKGGRKRTKRRKSIRNKSKRNKSKRNKRQKSRRN